MSNNERFNQLLNSFHHPRVVYVALTSLATAAQETCENIPEHFAGKSGQEIISKAATMARRTGVGAEAQAVRI